MLVQIHTYPFAHKRYALVLQAHLLFEPGFSGQADLTACA